MYRFTRYALYAVFFMLFAASCQASTIHVDGSTYACSATGINNAIAALPKSSGVVIVDGCSGTVPIASKVAIPQGVDLVLQPAVYQASTCPAFSITGEAGVLEGTAQGNPRAAYSTSGPYATVIQAVSGCSGPIVNFDILAGTKGGTIRNIRIDGNSISGATAGIEVGTATDGQVERNIIRDVSIGGLLTGSACLKVDAQAQSLLVDNLSAQLCAKGLDLEAAGLNHVTIENSLITCNQQAVPCYVVGKDSSAPGDASEEIEFINDDIETAASGTAPSMIGKLQNVLNFKLIGGRHEAGIGPMTTMLVMGDSSSTPSNPSIIGTFFQGDNNASYGIEFNSVFYPNINGVTFVSVNNNGIKNTSGNTGGTILASRPGNAGTPLDNLVGISMVNENSTIANSFPIFGQGFAVTGGTAPTVGPGQVSFGSGNAATASAGTNGAVPSQVAGYLIINIAGTTYKIPYFPN